MGDDEWFGFDQEDSWTGLNFSEPWLGQIPGNASSSRPTVPHRYTRSEIYGTCAEALLQERLFGHIDLKADETYRRLKDVNCTSKDDLMAIARYIAGPKKIPRHNKRSKRGMVAFLQKLIIDQDCPAVQTIGDIVTIWKKMTKRS